MDFEPRQGGDRKRLFEQVIHVLQVVERGVRGSIGEARIVLKPGDPAYRETLDRVGGLRPGEMKAMPAGSDS